jgi:putative DNA primase/helicase
VKDRPHNTDAGNAERLVALHGKDLRHCHVSGKWFCWDGRRWAIDDTGEVVRRATDTVREIYVEAATQDDSSDRDATALHARRSEHESRLRAMIVLARSEPGIPIRPEDLDRDPWRLNVANGTLDLRTGELLPQLRDDLLTKLVPVEFDPTALCPLWDAFLDRIFGGDSDLISYVRRVAGYALTGSTNEQVFFLLYGTGANGKSTFLEVLRTLLADYAKTTGFSTFIHKAHSGVSNDLARLAGARLVTAQEVEGGARLAEALVKQMTGGDTVQARFLYAEHFEFRPTFKLFLAANHKPLIRGTDHAIWRRTRLVPFVVTIPEEEQDRDLVVRLKDELPGILAWAVRGCLEWQRDGLGSAAAVSGATREYREDSDILGAFFAERCVLGEAERAAASDIYESYKDWAQRSGEQPVSQTAFGRQLAERGFIRRKSAGRSLWQGVGVTVGEGREGLDRFPGKSPMRDGREEEAGKPSNHPRTVPSDDENTSPAGDG